MVNNFFDFGSDSQLNIIRYYTDQIYNSDPMDEDSYVSFFMSILDQCIIDVAEHEEIPSWVFDREKYREKSPVFIISLLVNAFYKREIPAINLNESLNLDSSFSIGPDGFGQNAITQVIPYFFRKIMPAINDYCKKNNIDIELTSFEIIKVLGLFNTNHITNIYQKQYNSEEDFN